MTSTGSRRWSARTITALGLMTTLAAAAFVAAVGCAPATGAGLLDSGAGGVAEAARDASTAEPRLKMFVAREVDPRADGATGRLHPLPGAGVLLLEASPLLTGRDVISTDWTRTASGEPMLSLRLTPQAGARVFAMTTSPEEIWFAFVWDDAVVSAPRIMGTLSERLGLMGDAAELEAISAWLAADRTG